MRLLALDTATEACSVAVTLDGAVYEHTELGRQHSEGILVMVDRVLAEAGVALSQLDAIAFGRGPGLFTGLRIGAGVTQGLAFGADLPVVPVSSLAALAQGIAAERVLAAFDARMQQVYFAAFTRASDGLVQAACSEVVCDPAAVPLLPGEGWYGAGSGWDAYHASLRARLGARVSGWDAGQFPRARHVAALAAPAVQRGQLLPAEQALPVYVRDEVAHPAARAAAGAGRDL